jgi:hypothetical protein
MPTYAAHGAHDPAAGVVVHVSCLHGVKAGWIWESWISRSLPRKKLDIEIL